MTVKQKQCLLAFLGYYTGAIDGIWGDTPAALPRHSSGTINSRWTAFSGTARRRVSGKLLLPESCPNSPKIPRRRTAAQTGGRIKRAEFRCTCGRCGGFPVEPQESIARTVDEIRYRLGIPISIVDGGGSGVRCAAHNAEVGGVANSQHLYGLAADLHSAASPAEMYAVAEEVMGHTGGIDLYSWGIHVDRRSGYARWKG